MKEIQLNEQDMQAVEGGGKSNPLYDLIHEHIREANYCARFPRNFGCKKPPYKPYPGPGPRPIRPPTR